MNENKTAAKFDFHVEIRQANTTRRPGSLFDAADETRFNCKHRNLLQGLEMAARIRRIAVTEKWREKIRTGMLIHRLQKHALSELVIKDRYGVDAKGKKVKIGVALVHETEMSDSQIKATLGLLAKVAPDLNRTELHGGDEDKPIQIKSINSLSPELMKLLTKKIGEGL